MGAEGKLACVDDSVDVALALGGAIELAGGTGSDDEPHPITANINTQIPSHTSDREVFIFSPSLSKFQL